MLGERPKIKPSIIMNGFERSCKKAAVIAFFPSHASYYEVLIIVTSATSGADVKQIQLRGIFPHFIPLLAHICPPI